MLTSGCKPERAAAANLSMLDAFVTAMVAG